MYRLIVTLLCIPGACLVFVGLASFDMDFGVNGKDFPRVPVTAANDCGAVGLYLICKMHGRDDVTLDYLTALTCTTETGTNMLRLKEAVQHLGFVAEGVKLGSVELRKEIETGAMAILHVSAVCGGKGTFYNHFIPIIGTTRRRNFLAADGESGPFELTAADLAADLRWTGNTLLIRPLHN